MYFNDHWRRHFSEKIPESKKNEAKYFLAHVLEYLNENGLCILDIGCGDGVHLAILLEHMGENDKLLGLDIADGAIRQLKKAYPMADLFVADATQVPLTDQSMDVVFSFGVIGYTESPRRCFDEMVRVLRPGGLLGLWVAPRGKGLLFRLFSLTRAITARLPRPLVLRMADLLVPWLHFLPTRSHISLKNATWKQCREIVMVNIAPQRLHFFKRSELIDYINEHGLEIVQEDSNNPFTFWVTKPLTSTQN